MKSDVKRYCVKEGSTVLDAFARMQANDVGELYVVSGENIALGFLTDDAVRTLVLEGNDLSGEAVAAMSKKIPTVIDPDPAKASKVFKRSGTRTAALIVDGRITDVVVNQDPAPTSAPPIAVIMAGGRGDRLRPLTDKVPKPLLKLGTTSIVERIMLNLAQAGIEHVYLSVNYKAKVFERRLKDGSHLGITLEYLREEEKLDTAGALSLLPTKPKGPILVTNADILTRLDYARLLEFHQRHGGIATMGAVTYSHRVPYGVARTAKDSLVKIDEKPESRSLCNAGIYVLEPSVLKFVKKNTALSMPDLLSNIVGSGAKVSVFPVLEKWFDIGSPEDFQRVLLEFATYEEE